MKINFSTKFPDEFLQLTLLYQFTAISIDQKQIVFIIKLFTSFSDPYHFYPIHYKDISTYLLSFAKVDIHQYITFS